MNILIIILIVLASLIIILLIGALLTKREYTIMREITINRPKHEVFNYVKLLKNQDYYNKWVMMDPTMKKEYKGIDGTVGFVYAWESNNKQVGMGEQEIIKIKEGESIDHELRFMKPFEGKATARLIPASVPGSDNRRNETRVNWVFNGLRNYPMKIVHLLFNLKKVLGKDLQTSLATLKAVLEKE